MPCYQVNTVSVEFQARHFGTLQKAVAALGGTLQRSGERATVVIGPSTITINNGIATGRERLVNNLRVAYARQITIQATEWAKQKGWHAQQTGSKLTLSKGNR